MDLGLDDYLYGDGICVLEWAEKVISLMPRNRLLIRIEYTGDTERRLLLEPSGERYLELAGQIMKTYKDPSE
jgi:tRNA threonylcarbamoyladenosine biosynthesis protein TsaE